MPPVLITKRHHSHSFGVEVLRSISVDEIAAENAARRDALQGRVQVPPTQQGPSLGQLASGECAYVPAD